MIRLLHIRWFSLLGVAFARCSCRVFGRLHILRWIGRTGIGVCRLLLSKHYDKIDVHPLGWADWMDESFARVHRNRTLNALSSLVRARQTYANAASQRTLSAVVCNSNASKIREQDLCCKTQSAHWGKERDTFKTKRQLKLVLRKVIIYVRSVSCGSLTVSVCVCSPHSPHERWNSMRMCNKFLSPRFLSIAFSWSHNSSPSFSGCNLTLYSALCVCMPCLVHAKPDAGRKMGY